MLADYPCPGMSLNPLGPAIPLYTNKYGSNTLNNALFIHRARYKRFKPEVAVVSVAMAIVKDWYLRWSQSRRAL